MKWKENKLKKKNYVKYTARNETFILKEKKIGIKKKEIKYTHSLKLNNNREKHKEGTTTTLNLEINNYKNNPTTKRKHIFKQDFYRRNIINNNK